MGIEAEEVTDSSHRIDFAILDNWCRNGTDLLLRVKGPVFVGNLIGVGPEHFAGRFLKTVDAFLGLGLHHQGIGKIDPALRHHRTGKPPSHRDTPADL